MIYIDFHMLGGAPMELLILLGVVAVWFVLNRWIFPRLGFDT